MFTEKVSFPVANSQKSGNRHLKLITRVACWFLAVRVGLDPPRVRFCRSVLGWIRRVLVLAGPCWVWLRRVLVRAGPCRVGLARVGGPCRIGNGPFGTFGLGPVLQKVFWDVFEGFGTFVT